MGETEQHEMIGETAFMLRRLRQSPPCSSRQYCLAAWLVVSHQVRPASNASGPAASSVYGPLVISGPGRVRFGDNCLIISNAIKPVCIRTLSRDASVTLGDNAGLNGTSIQSVGRVAGDLSNIAMLISLTRPPVSAGAAEWSRSPRRRASCGFGERLGIRADGYPERCHSRRRLIGACTLVREDVPEGVLVAGNPMKVIKSVDS